MAETTIARSKWRDRLAAIAAMFLATVFSLVCAERPVRAADQPGAECLACHGDKTMTTTRAGKTVSIYVDGKKFATSIHASFGCTGCHADLEGKDFPHDKPARVKCGTCHSDEQALYSKSLHGKAVARGDALAPSCVNCHGNHAIYPVK